MYILVLYLMFFMMHMVFYVFMYSTSIFTVFFMMHMVLMCLCILVYLLRLTIPFAVSNHFLDFKKLRN